MNDVRYLLTDNEYIILNRMREKDEENGISTVYSTEDILKMYREGLNEAYNVAFALGEEGTECSEDEFIESVLDEETIAEFLDIRVKVGFLENLPDGYRLSEKAIQAIETDKGIVDDKLKDMVDDMSDEEVIEGFSILLQEVEEIKALETNRKNPH